MRRLGVANKTELSVKLGVSKSTITNWEAGKFTDSTSKLLHHGVSMDWFLTGAGGAGRKSVAEEDLLTVVLAHGRAVDKYLDDISRLETETKELRESLKKMGADEKATETRA